METADDALMNSEKQAFHAKPIALQEHPPPPYDKPF